uniref:Uncharacterized protein n=1 Tax=Triticum urartu TaxID=4572 RepID=A0A8R7PE04_TRIUA
MSMSRSEERPCPCPVTISSMSFAPCRWAPRGRPSAWSHRTTLQGHRRCVVTVARATVDQRYKDDGLQCRCRGGGRFVTAEFDIDQPRRESMGQSL